jgi:hypothetical protein
LPLTSSVSFECIGWRVRRIGKALSALRGARGLVGTAKGVRRYDGREAARRELDALLARKRAAELADVPSKDPNFAATRRRARRAAKALAAVDFDAAAAGRRCLMLQVGFRDLKHLDFDRDFLMRIGLSIGG